MKEMYHVTRKLLKSNFMRLDSPVKITFAVTYACSFLCKTCNIGRKFRANPSKVTKDELTHEEIGKIFANAKPSWLQITGGEPFIRDMYGILKVIVNNDNQLYAAHTTTNGYNTKKIVDDVKKILTLKIPRFAVSISFDGFEEKHNEMRGIKKSFDQCIKTFLELQQLENEHFNVFISYTASPYNMGNIEKFILNMKEKYGIDAKYIHMNLYHTSSHFFGNEDVGRNEEYNNKVLNEIDAYNKYKKGNDFKVDFLEKRYSKYAKEFVKTGKSPLPCKALSSSCFLDSKGNVYPCLIWDNKLGNLRDYNYDLKKLWKETHVVKAQKDAENLRCPNCWTPCEAYQTVAGNLRKTLIA